MKTSCKGLLPELPAPNSIRRTDEGSYVLSLYDDLPVSEGMLMVHIARLKAAFPKMENVFFNILAERIVENGFTEKRLADAVNHVIDTFRYKELNVSDIIRFDRSVRLYTHDEVCRMWMIGAGQNDFEKRSVDGVTYWIRKVDLLNSRRTGEPAKQNRT
jgi:hypothetical protein